jgi:hypothetical protein
LSSGRLPAQRVEEWQSVVSRINHDQLPVCVYPNLVEDMLMESDAGLALQSRDVYWQFAVNGLSPVDRGENAMRPVESRSLVSPQSPSPAMLGEAKNAGAAWFLIRAGERDARRVVARIPEWIGERWHVRFEDFSQPPLYLFRITLSHSGEGAEEAGGAR